MRVHVFDYGAGNLHSLVKALEGADCTIVVTTDPRAAVSGADALILLVLEPLRRQPNAWRAVAMRCARPLPRGCPLWASASACS